MYLIFSSAMVRRFLDSASNWRKDSRESACCLSAVFISAVSADSPCCIFPPSQPIVADLSKATGRGIHLDRSQLQVGRAENHSGPLALDPAWPVGCLSVSYGLLPHPWELWAQMVASLADLA